MSERREVLVGKLVSLARRNGEYEELYARILEVWDGVKRRTCSGCGSPVELDGPYAKCRACGHFETVLGFEATEVGGPPHMMSSLVRIGALTVTIKTSRHTHYALASREAEEAMREALRRLEEERALNVPLAELLPKDLFADVVGLDHVKRILIRALSSKEVPPPHVLLVGPPASAKSMMLEELERRLPEGTVVMVLAGSTTRAGLRDLIAEATPRVLLIDELDKFASPQDLSALLTWMQSQRLKITMWERRVEAECPYADGCKVIAAANTTSRIPRELLSRFLVVRVPEYTERQVTDICVALLSKRGRGERYAKRVAELVVGELRSRDPRDCLKLDGLAGGSEEELEEVVRDLKEGVTRLA